MLLEKWKKVYVDRLVPDRPQTFRLQTIWMNANEAQQWEAQSNEVSLVLYSSSGQRWALNVFIPCIPHNLEYTKYSVNSLWVNESIRCNAYHNTADSRQLVNILFHGPRVVGKIHCQGDHWLQLLSGEDTAFAFVDLVQIWMVFPCFRGILDLGYQKFCNCDSSSYDWERIERQSQQLVA